MDTNIFSSPIQEQAINALVSNFYNDGFITQPGILYAGQPQVVLYNISVNICVLFDDTLLIRYTKAPSMDILIRFDGVNNNVMRNIYESMLYVKNNNPTYNTLFNNSLMTITSLIGKYENVEQIT